MENGKWLQTYLFIWSGQFISMLTSYAVNFAIVIWLSLEHSSAEVLAIAGISALFPQALIGPFAGVFIDRWNRKKVLILSDAFLALCALIMIILLRDETVNLNWIYLMLGLRSIGNAFHSPAMQALAPLLVPQQELLRVAGINQLLQSLSRIAGPAIGTLAITYMSIPNVLYLDVLGAVAAITSLVAVHIPHVRRPIESFNNVVMELKDGFETVVQNRVVRLLFLFAMMVTFFIMPAAIMFPLLTTGHYQGGKLEMSLIEIVWSVGMLIGGTILGAVKIRIPKIILVNTMHILLGTSFILCGGLPSGWFIGYATTTFFGGVAISIFSASFAAILQEEIAPSILGRVFSMYYSMAVLPTIVGLLFTGAIAETIGVANSFLISGVVVVLIGVLSFLTSALTKSGKQM